MVARGLARGLARGIANATFFEGVNPFSCFFGSTAVRLHAIGRVTLSGFLATTQETEEAVLLLFNSQFRGLTIAAALAASWNAPCCLAASEAAVTATATTATAISAPLIAAKAMGDFGVAFDPTEFLELTVGGPAPASLNTLGAKGLVLESRTSSGDGAFYVFSSPELATFSATFLLRDGRLTGVIDHPGDMRTTVTSVRAGFSAARVENALNDLSCGCEDRHLRRDVDGPVGAGGAGDGGVAGGPCDNGSTVDVLVVYTNAAVAQAGSSASLLDSINWAIADSNAIYAGSGIGLQARLVGTSLLPTYVENADMGVDLDRLTATADGIIDNVHALRDSTGADLVALVRADGGGFCGIAWLLPSNSTANANLGFSVTALGCFSNRTFTHELGHNMGCCHAPGDGGGCTDGGVFNYAVGHRFFGADSQQYRTVMAYSPGTRIPRFSSPFVNWASTPTGIANTRDNARAINETRLAFTNFRCSADGSGSCGGPGNCFAPHGGQGCVNTSCCEAVCAEDPFCCTNSWDQVCVNRAINLCSDCGESTAGSCFATHPTPSCNNAECCAAVCAVDPFCCNTQWDQFCVNEAIEQCPNCGDPETGSCYTSKATPFCENAACCELVCATDPFCCDTRWDSACVSAAIANCPGCGNPNAGSCYESRPNPYCADESCCDTVCAADPFCCNSNWDQFCVNRAIEECPSCENPANTASCYAPHAGTYCNDSACCEVVCDLDPFCCSTQWDSACAASAIKSCPGCENPGNTASCYAPHEGTYCNDSSCCATVCAKDPFCCTNEWDEFCAESAAENCPGCGNPNAGSCYAARETPFCESADCCATVCAADPFCCETRWDQFCVNRAITDCPSCENPSNGDCLIAHPTPNCNTPECCSTVCAVDPFCCTTAWDSDCVSGATNLCVESCGGSLANDCCTPHDATHCSDAACCAAVCGIDPFCCETEWDELCATRAVSTCAVCAPKCRADLNGDGNVGAADLATLLSAWGTADPLADLNGDGVVGAPDLAELLSSWGPC